MTRPGGTLRVPDSQWPHRKKNRKSDFRLQRPLPSNHHGSHCPACRHGRRHNRKRRCCVSERPSPQAQRRIATRYPLGANVHNQCCESSPKSPRKRQSINSAHRWRSISSHPVSSLRETRTNSTADGLASAKEALACQPEQRSRFRRGLIAKVAQTTQGSSNVVEIVCSVIADDAICPDLVLDTRNLDIDEIDLLHWVLLIVDHLLL